MGKASPWPMAPGIGLLSSTCKNFLEVQKDDKRRMAGLINETMALGDLADW